MKEIMYFSGVLCPIVSLSLGSFCTEDIGDTKVVMVRSAELRARDQTAYIGAYKATNQNKSYNKTFSHLL